VEAIRVLLEHGANVDATTRMEETVLGQSDMSSSFFSFDVNLHLSLSIFH